MFYFKMNIAVNLSLFLRIIFRTGDEESPMTLPRTKKELTDAVYRTLPPSLTQPCIVRSKVRHLCKSVEVNLHGII